MGTDDRQYFGMSKFNVNVVCELNSPKKVTAMHVANPDGGNFIRYEAEKRRFAVFHFSIWRKEFSYYYMYEDQEIAPYSSEIKTIPSLFTDW